MQKIITENRNEKTKDIDLISTFEIIKKINDEDKTVANAIEKELTSIVKAVDLISDKFLSDGKLYYFGAGTSGRLGVLDASECPPTFGVSPDMVKGIIAGGDSALRNAIEGAEDNYELGLFDGKILTSNDVAVLISASGNPKYLKGVAKTAKENKCPLIAITCNKKADILKLADINICVEVGAEVITGSSRMKAGTCQKMILNILSTASMIKIGKTYENYMIDVKATNVKLKQRAISIVSEIANINENKAENILISCDWKIKEAILMIMNNISQEKAQFLLKNNNGILRKALGK